MSEVKVGQIHSGTVTFDVFLEPVDQVTYKLIAKNTPHRNPPTEIYELLLQKEKHNPRLLLKLMKKPMDATIVKGYVPRTKLYSIMIKAHSIANKFVQQHGFGALSGTKAKIPTNVLNKYKSHQDRLADIGYDQAGGESSSEFDQDKVSERLYDITMNKEGEAYEGETQELLGKWQELTGKRAPGFMENRISMTVNMIAESMEETK